MSYAFAGDLVVSAICRVFYVTLKRAALITR